MKRVAEKFISYAEIFTTSVEDALQVPSSMGQWDLARQLELELKNLGVENAHVDENCFVIGTIPSNVGVEAPTIAFFAHLDTAPNEPGENVKPQLISNYDGGEILLNKELGITMKPEQYPALKDYVGKTLITTDGTTLLGADDKAGIAIIMEMVNRIKEEPSLPHGKVVVCFTPDEEVSPGGAEMFDVEKLGADFAYTIDGEGMGEFNCETFNAAGAIITVKGENIHPGEGKDKMVNASLIAAEFAMSLPERETPSHTEEREGFYHLDSMIGGVAEAKLEYIIRDFDIDVLEKRKTNILAIAEKLNEKYGQGRVNVNLTTQYFNMAEDLKKCPRATELAVAAYKECGIDISESPIRGGTDGARFSRKGLPTPNIFAAGHNFHSKYEFSCVEAMEAAAEVLLKIVELNTK